jgi:hypothetical protein
VPPAKRSRAATETDETTPRDEAVDSSEDSAASSTSNGHGFIADPGPAHDPEAAPPPDEPAPELLDAAWDPEVVKGLLTAQGQALHTFAGKGADDWVYTRDELRAIAPPLTRILNRYDATRMAAATGDEFALIIGLTGYVGRSITVRRDALRELRDDEEELEPIEVYVPSEQATRATTAAADDELPETPPTPRRR